MKKTILIADDFSDFRILLSEIIKMDFPDYDCECFENGTLLDERLNGNLEGVYAVVTDNEMPGIKGSDIIKKRASNLKHLHFILYYAGDERIGKEAIKNGAYDYVIKEGRKKLSDVLRGALEI